MLIEKLIPKKSPLRLSPRKQIIPKGTSTDVRNFGRIKPYSESILASYEQT
jgi:hypothetical protein